MNVDYPFHFDGNGQTARTDWLEHIRDMVEQLLFTSPGERVNRPELGAGLRQLVFEPNSEELVSALEFTLRASLQRFLDDVLIVQDLRVSREDSRLDITVQYLVRSEAEPQRIVVSRENAV